MQTKRVLVTARFLESELNRLKPPVEEFQFAGWRVDRIKMNREALLERLPEFQMLILEFESITREVLEAANELQIIGCCRTGPEANIDIECATELGIPVLNTPGRNAISVAEYTLGLMISLARHISQVDHLLRYTSELTQVDYEDKPVDRRGVTSEWSLDANAPFNRFTGPELFGKTMGLVGCGAIGREIAYRARAFGMKILVYDPFVAPEALVAFDGQKVELDELAQRSDFVVMATKVCSETQGLFSKDLFEMMKPTALFINTARAALVDYEALYQILKDKKIAGAALDVYRTEPISGDDKAFLSLKNVVLSPHLAGASEEVFHHHSRIMVDDLLRAFEGERPTNLVNPEVWERSRLIRALNA